MQHGFSLLWVVLVAIAFQTIFNTEVMRYTLATGEPVFSGFMRTRPSSTLWAWVYVILYFLQVGWPAWAGTAAAAMFYLVVQRLPGAADATTTYVIGVAAFLVIAVWPVMLVTFATGVTVAIVVPLAVATGIGFALFDVFWNTTMAEQIPPHALSRASAYEWMGSLALLPVGYLAAGPVAEATSTETVLVGGAILTAIVLALGLVPRDTRLLRGGSARSRV